MNRKTLTGALWALVVTAFCLRGSGEDPGQATEQASWPSHDSVSVRLLVEAAADEILSLCISDLGHDSEIRTALARLAAGEPRKALEVRGYLPAQAQLEAVVLGRAAGADLALTHGIQLWKERSVSTDREEYVGILQIEVEVAPRQGAGQARQHLSRKHSFRIGRVGPAPEIAALKLLVLLPPEDLSPNLEGGLIFAPPTETPVSFFQMLDSGFRDGTLGGAPPGKRAMIGRAIRDVLPGAMEQRAHFLLGSAEELRDFIHGHARRKEPIEGIVHGSFEEPFELAAGDFRGNAMLSFSGPVRLGEIRMHDPGQDRLTIVSAQTISVRSGRVEAGLIALTPGIGEVVLEKECEIQGFIFSSSFPSGVKGCSERTLADTRIGGTRNDGNLVTRVSVIPQTEEYRAGA